MSEDKDISRRYRELPREEPPRALDDAILAASRRAVEARPAPLVAPAGRRRWYFPLAAAAIIVLAVAVTMHVERQQPDAEEVTAAVPVAPEPPPAAPAPAKQKMAAKPAQPEAAREEAQSYRRDVPATSAAAPAPRAMARLAAPPPEQWLQEIADLRRQGRDEEADKALAEFRKRYPDYRLSDEMRARVEKKPQ